MTTEPPPTHSEFNATEEMPHRRAAAFRLQPRGRRRAARGRGGVSGAFRLRFPKPARLETFPYAPLPLAWPPRRGVHAFCPFHWGVSWLWGATTPCVSNVRPSTRGRAPLARQAAARCLFPPVASRGTFPRQTFRRSRRSLSVFFQQPVLCV